MPSGHYENGVWYPDDPKIRAMLDRQHLLQPSAAVQLPRWLKRLWERALVIYDKLDS